MFLEVYDKLVHVFMTNQPQAIKTVENKELAPVRENLASLNIYEPLATYKPYNNTLSGVMFGSDPTPVSYKDYRLGSPISGLTVSAEVTKENYSNEIVALYTITNNTGNDVTIAEVGLSWNWALLDRTVLENPITIPSGSIGQLTYTITFNRAE